MEHTVRLDKQLERVVKSGHPWIYREALRGALPSAGTVVDLVSSRGELLARGLAESEGIGLRLWTTVDEPVDEALMARRIALAVALRDKIVPSDTNAYRLVHGEGDRMPGLVCDVYGSYAVMRLDGDSLVPWLDRVVATLWPALSSRGVETLLIRRGPRGQQTVEVIEGTAPDGTVWVTEHEMRMPADLLQGQKTGLFLDHRESRYRLRALARGQRVLNLYGYTGGFSVSAGLGGASHVVTVDRSRWACALADEAWIENGLDPSRHESHARSVQAFFDGGEAGDTPFDVIVSDPPNLAPSKRAKDKALQTYRALHRASLAHLVPGGLYLAASCSSHIDKQDFDKSIADGARQAGKVVQILERWGAPGDHPRLAAFPEGDYLKVVLARLVP